MSIFLRNFSKRSTLDKLHELFRDKKVKPIFWIITVVYFLLLASLILSANGRPQVLALLILPYFIFCMIYMAYVHRKDK